MNIEKKFIDFIMDTRYSDIPAEIIDLMKTILVGIVGSIIAGVNADEVGILYRCVREWGGSPESSVFLHDCKALAQNAALVNGTMALAVDYDDAVVPGVHIGCVSVSAGLSVAEMQGGCSGKELLASLVVGTEFANRINTVNLKSFYGGFHGLD